MASDQAWARGWNAAMSNLSGEAFEVASNFNLLVIPMFVLMGNLAGVSGMSRDLFHRGATAGSAISGAASPRRRSRPAPGSRRCPGSSLASAVTMGRVALPEMNRFKYAPELSTGAVAAGGTLGFLIPPSGGMIIYAVLTDQSIGRLFMAGVVPGIVLTLLFIGAVWLTVRLRPEKGPAGDRATPGDRRRSIRAAVPIVLVVGITIGGMYTGFFTPVEASAVGALLTFLVAAWRRALDAGRLRAVVLQTMKATATVFLIIIGAFVFIPFMSLTGLAGDMVTFLTSLPIGEIGVLIVVILIYMFLGTFLEGIAMLVLTIPVVMALATQLQWDLIWFGIIVVIVLEMGMISPPVGINVFVVKSIAPEVPMRTIFRGIWPFWFAMAVMIALLVAFPGIAMFLPNTMLGS